MYLISFQIVMLNSLLLSCVSDHLSLKMNGKDICFVF